MESMEGSGDAYEVSIGSDGKPIGEKGARGTRNYSSVVLRFGVGLLSAFAVAGASNLLVAYPLTARLEPWAVLHLTIGILLGPAGILGSVTGYFLVQALQVSSLLGVSMQAAAYLLVGTISYFVFRLAPRLDRGLSNLRSYLAFLGAAILSSFALAVIGSASLFLRIMGKDGFWIAINYWFASSFTSLLIIAPFILIVVSWGFRRWLVPMPGEKIPAYVSGTQPAASEREIGRRARRDIAVGAALILGTTLIVCPLASLQPRNGWFALLYLVPILWGSTSRGLRGGGLGCLELGRRISCRQHNQRGPHFKVFRPRGDPQSIRRAGDLLAGRCRHRGVPAGSPESRVGSCAVECRAQKAQRIPRSGQNTA